MRLGNLLHNFQIKWLGPTHVDHGSIQWFRHFESFVKQRSKAQNGQAFPLSYNLGLTQGQRGQRFFHLNPSASAPGVANGNGMILRVGRTQQLATLVFIGWAGYAHVGNAAGKGNVKHAGMRRPIGANQASPVQCKHNG